MCVYIEYVYIECIYRIYIKKFCRFSVDIDKILREIGLVEIVGATLIICSLEYYCITVIHKQFLT